MQPQKGFLRACLDFFGLLPGQRALDFGHELSQLTHEDKVEIAIGLHLNGIDCADPVVKAAA